MTVLRVHSKDLQEHVVAEAGEWFESGLHTDIAIRCRDGQVVNAHKLVLAAVSPFLKDLLDVNTDLINLELPDIDKKDVQSLLEIVYTGSIEATMEEIRRMLILSHTLYIAVPLTEQLSAAIGIQFPSNVITGQGNVPMPGSVTLPTTPAMLPPGLSQDAASAMFLKSLNSPALSLLQQQLLAQYALLNSLVPEPPKSFAQPTPAPFTAPIPAAVKALIPTLPTSTAASEQVTEKEKINQQLNDIIAKSYKVESGSYTCGVCNSSYSNRGNFRQHAEKHLKNGEFSPPINGKTAVVNGGAGSVAPVSDPIVLSGFDPSINLYRCNVCQGTYNHPGNFKQHMLKHERGQKTKAEKGKDGNHLSNVLQSAFAERVDNGDPSKSYVCHECNRTFKHPGNFKQHLASHNRPQITAGPMSTDLVELLKRPLPSIVRQIIGDANGNSGQRDKDDKQGQADTRMEVCDSEEEWDCPECREKFTKDTLLQAHMKARHDIEMVLQNDRANGEEAKNKLTNGGQNGAMEIADDGPEDGEERGIGLKDVVDSLEACRESVLLGNDEAMKALAMAAGEARLANFHCDAPGCYLSFTTEGWLQRHRAKQHPDLPPPKPSEVAGVTAAMAAVLAANPVLQQAPVSPPSPAAAAGLANSRVYPCPQCGKIFHKTNKLTQHMKTHSPESHYRYPCDICGKKFTRPQHVNRHKLLHTGERPHTCNTCDKTFAREDKLKIHIKSGCTGNVEVDVGHENGSAKASKGGKEDVVNNLKRGTLTVGVMG